MPFTKSQHSEPKIPLIIRFYDPETRPHEARDVHGRSLIDILEWPDMQLERSHNYIQMLFPLPEGSMFNWEAPLITHEIMLEFRARSELRDGLRKALERMLYFYGFMVSHSPKEQFMQPDEDEERIGNRNGHETMDVQAARTIIGSLEGTNQSQASRTPTGATLEDLNGAASQLQPNEASVDPFTAECGNGFASEMIKSANESTQDPAVNDVKKAAPSSSTTKEFGYYIVRASHWRKQFRNWAVRFDHNHLRITRILRCLRVLGLEKECEAFFTALQNVFEDPKIRINERSMIYWQRAATRALYITPDDDRCGWLKKWEDEQDMATSVK